MLEIHDPNAEVFNMVREGDVLCITTNGTVKQNGACVMGRGIARQVRDNIPGIDLRLGDLLKKYGNRCFQLGWYFVGPYKVLFVSFPVKHNWNEIADITLICKSCEELVQLADKFGYKKVYLPAPGCGNGKLNYEVTVQPWVSALLDDRFICVRR